MRQAVELRAKDWSFRAIAAHLGVDASTIMRDLRRAPLQKLAASATPPVASATPDFQRAPVARLYCDACDNIGICDYGNGNEPCRSVMHHAARVAAERTGGTPGADNPVGDTDEPHAESGDGDSAAERRPQA
jgi:hypothetical protein